MIVEAVATTPIWIAMMTVPEGEGIAGQRMERGYSILLALVLRPTLMIIGLLASLLIMYTAFRIFNNIFMGLTVSSSWNAFEGLAIVIIYVQTIMLIAKQSIQIIFELPNNVLEWTGSVGRSFGDNDMAQKAENFGGNLHHTARDIGQQATSQAQAQSAGRQAGIDNASKAETDVQAKEDATAKAAGRSMNAYGKIP